MSTPVAGERVSAVIVHYRTPAETLRAARAVAATAPAAEIVVVDNDSRDGIGRLLAAQVPSARLLNEDVNRGFGAGCNRGARETSRPYLLFLNSDAFVKAGAVAALEAALDAERRAAAVGPRLLNADGTLQPSVRRLPTPWRIFCESSGLAFLSRGRRPFEGHTATRQDHSGRREADALMGAALLVRREALEDAGGFDEAFFLYAEETDLMARWKKRRWTLLYEPRAEVVHEGGRSGGDALFGQLHASLVRYTGKHHGRSAARFAGAVLDAGAALRYAAALFTPGPRGRVRRVRYRSAMRRRSAAAAVPIR
ncbi:MAG TPA: glycosyltransferase [Thermoanaerobaculia bacterium]|nr:glycosyltransferase [Thermoanaerobaculia bacterium]